MTETLLDEIVLALASEQKTELENFNDWSLEQAVKDSDIALMKSFEETQLYTLNLPYDSFDNAYSFDYTAEAIELNEKSTEASYTAEVREEDTVEAAWDIIEDAKQQRESGIYHSTYSQSLESRERADVMKAINPARFMMMYDHPELKGFL